MPLTPVSGSGLPGQLAPGQGEAPQDLSRGGNATPEPSHSGGDVADPEPTASRPQGTHDPRDTRGDNGNRNAGNPMGALQGGSNSVPNGWTRGVGNPHNPANQNNENGNQGRGDGGRASGQNPGVGKGGQDSYGNTASSGNYTLKPEKGGGLGERVGDTLIQLGAALGKPPGSTPPSSSWTPPGTDPNSARAGGQQGSQPGSQPGSSGTPGSSMQGPQPGQNAPPTHLSRGDAAATPRMGADSSPLASGRGASERMPGATMAQTASNASPAAQSSDTVRSGLQATAAQAMLGGGLAAAQAGQAQLAQGAAAQLQTPQQVPQQAVPQQASVQQGNTMAQSAGTAAQEKPQTLAQQQAQQQNAAKELRNAQPQQLPAEAKARAETAADRALAKQGAEQPGRSLADARNAEAQARNKGLGLRDGALDAKRSGLTENTRQTVNENARRGELATNGTDRRPAGAMASLRHALDWVGQHARGDLAGGARTDEEGATTMRVVAGLIVAAVFVGVAVAVLYALRIAFVP